MGKISKEEWIKRFKKVHNDKYDYSLVDYKNNNTKIKIKCNKCGKIFKQRPSDHAYGHGCPYCYGTHRKTTEQFIDEAKKVHGDKYDYSLVDYKGNKIKVNIKCNKCEKIFKQGPIDHLHGQGCPYCSGKLKKTTEQFIEEAKKIHGDKYDYSLVEYKNTDTKIKIKCNKCGKIFEQTPHNHLKKFNCPKCKKISSFKMTEFNIEVEYVSSDFRKEYLKLISNAKKNQPTENYEVHHIFPKSMFPLWKDKEANLIKLSYTDHYKAHYLLYKIYKNKEMALAFKFMLGLTNKKYNPELYDEIKKQLIGRQIYCYELDKQYDFIVKAVKEVGGSPSSIRKACKDWRYKSANFHWCYLEDKDKAINYWKNNATKGKLGKQVYCLELNKVFNSKKIAAREIGLKSITSLSQACKDWRYKSANFYWCYLEDKSKAIDYWKKILEN